MKTLMTVIITAITLTIAQFSLAVWEGRHATEDTMFYKADAVSYCLQGAWTEEFRLAQFPECLKVTLRVTERQQDALRVSQGFDSVRVTLDRIDEGRDALEKWRDL